MHHFIKKRCINHSIFRIFMRFFTNVYSFSAYIMPYAAHFFHKKRYDSHCSIVSPVSFLLISASLRKDSKQIPFLHLHDIIPSHTHCRWHPL